MKVELKDIENHIQILEKCIEAQSDLSHTSVFELYEPELLKMIKRYRINKYQIELELWNRMKKEREKNIE